MSLNTEFYCYISSGSQLLILDPSWHLRAGDISIYDFTSIPPKSDPELFLHSRHPMAIKFKIKQFQTQFGWFWPSNTPKSPKKGGLHTISDRSFMTFWIWDQNSGFVEFFFLMILSIVFYHLGHNRINSTWKPRKCKNLAYLSKMDEFCWVENFRLFDFFFFFFFGFSKDLRFFFFWK